MWRSAAAFALAGLLAACSGERTPDGTWRGSVDTLESGVVVVHNPATGVWRPDQAWRIERDLSIGVADGDGPDTFGQVRDLAVDAAGRIYVLDGQVQEVRVFDTLGRPVRTVGRKGAGPGELLGATGLMFAPDGRLWVVDPQAARYSAWDTAGTFLAGYRRPGAATSGRWRGGFDHQGHLYDIGAVFDVAVESPERRIFQGRHEILLELGDSAQVIDSVRLPEFETLTFSVTRRSGIETSTIRMAVPFTPRLLWALDPRGYVVSAITDRYRIVFQAFGGDTVRIVERAYQTVAVTKADRAREVERLKQFREWGGEINQARFGKTQPAVNQLYVDDGDFLWVRPALTASARRSGGVTFDVFDPDGRYLGMARTDFAISGVMVVRGDHLYAMVLDSLDVPSVVRGRIRGR